MLSLALKRYGLAAVLRAVSPTMGLRGAVPVPPLYALVTIFVRLLVSALLSTLIPRPRPVVPAAPKPYTSLLVENGALTAPLTTLLSIVVKPVAAPILTAVAAPNAFTVVAVASNKLNVV